jgi:hypothetical protein
MRWCYENKPVKGESLTPGRAQCRKLQTDDQTEFLKMLRDLEKVHAAGKRRESPTSTSQSQSGGGGAGSASTDRGEETVLQLIDKLVAGCQGAT